MDCIDTLVARLDPKLAAVYHKKRKALENRGHHEVLNLHYEKNSRMIASQHGHISDASQIDNLHIDLGGYEDVVRLEKLGRRFDLLMEALAPLEHRVWVLFLDQTEHMQNPRLRQFFMDYLVPRLHERFKGFRLYLTGQQVPTDMLPAHEVSRATLEVFSRGEVQVLCREVGIEDVSLQRAIEKLTGGHPLLVGMCLERGNWQRGEADLAEKLSREGDQGERTSWIYDRIIARFQHRATRDIAANLSLFEWFDLSLLRDVFEQEIGKRVFDELVRRSFIKLLAPGRWQCHDILRDHLATRCRQLDPVKTDRLQKRAFQHYLERIGMEEERVGERYFTGRIEYVTAALHAVLQFSIKESRGFCLAEMGPAVAYLNDTYLFSLSRFLESGDPPPAIEKLNQGMKRFLELVNLKKFTPELVAFLDEMIDALVERDERGLAIEVLHASVTISGELGWGDKSVAGARRALQFEDNLENRILLIETLAKTNRFDEAQELHHQTRAALGDSLDLRLSRADIELAAGHEDRGMNLLTDAILAFPARSDSARLRAAELLYGKGDSAGAREHVAAILAHDPDNRRARLMHIDLLAESGQVEAILPQLKSMRLSIGELGLEQMLQLAQNPDVLRAGVKEILSGENPVGLVPLLTLMDSLSIRGEVELVRDLLEITVKKWPETRSVCQGKLVFAYLSLGDTASAIQLGEALAASPSAPMDIPISLSIAYERLGQLEGARQVLRKADAFYPLRDLVHARTANLFVKEGEIEKAFNYLEAIERDGPLGTLAMTVLGDLYLRIKNPREALKIFEKLVYLSDNEEQLPQQNIQVRGKYAVVLASLGKKEKALQVTRNLTRYFSDWDEAYLVAGQLFCLLRCHDELVSLYRSIPEEKISRKFQVISLLVEAKIANFDPRGLLDELRQDTQRLDVVMALDLYYTARGKVEEALPLLREAEKISPGIIKRVEDLRAAAVRDFDPRKLQQIKAAVARQPENVMMKLALLRSLIDNGSVAEALERYEEFSRKHPEEINDFVISSCLIGSKYYKEAGPFLERVLGKDEIPQLFIGLLGQYLHHCAEPSRRIEFHLKVARQYADLRVDSLELAADTYLESGEPERALMVLEELASEEETPGTLLSKALAERRLKRREAALKTLRVALDHPALKFPLRARLLGEVGEILAEKGELTSAAAHFREGIVANEKRFQLYHQLAGVLAERGNWPEAYATLRNLVELDPGQLAKTEEKLRLYREKMAAREELDPDESPQKEPHPS